VFRKMSQQLRKPAGFLGKITARLMEKGNSNIYEQLFKEMNIRDGELLLEIGYGPGYGIDEIVKRFNACVIYGIDFSELMFKSASQRHKGNIDKGRIKLFYGDAAGTELEKKDFDKVYFTNVVYFWDDLKKPFNNLYNHLKDGGELHFYMAGREFLEKHAFTKDELFNKYTIEQIEEALKLSGFKSVEWKFEQGYYIKAIK